MWTSNIHDTALIFEGGGMRAAHSAGVVGALLAAGLHFDWVGGISAGSSCTVNYVLRDPDRARRSFVEIAADPRFAGWRTFVAGQGYFNAEWIYQQTSGPDDILPFDATRWAANPARVGICAIDVETGDTVHWGRAEMADVMAVARRVRASSTMPILMPFAPVDGRLYADGALGDSGGIYLNAARVAGFDRFVVIRTRQRGYRKSPPRLTRAMAWWLRKYPAVAEAMVTRWQRYNAVADELDALEADGKAFVYYPENMPVTNSTTDCQKLLAVYRDGLAQAEQTIEQISQFVGRPKTRPDDVD